jgi:hypothetical protein
MRRGLESGAPARALSPQFGLTGCDGRAGAGVRQKIITGEFVTPRLRLFEIGSQFLSTQARTLLDGDAMLLEQREVGSDHHANGGFAIGDAIELVRTRILFLVEPHVPQSHVSPVCPVYRHAARMRYRPLSKNHSPTLDGSSGVKVSDVKLSAGSSVPSGCFSVNFRCILLAALSRCHSMRAISFWRFLNVVRERVAISLISSTSGRLPQPAFDSHLRRLPARLATLARPTAAARTPKRIPESATAWRFWPGFINFQRPAIQVGSVESRNRAVSFRRIRHLDERKSARTPGIPVGDDFDAIHGSMRLKQQTDGGLSGSCIQIANKDLFHKSYPYVFQMYGLDEADPDPAKLLRDA